MHVYVMYTEYRDLAANWENHPAFVDVVPLINALGAQDKRDAAHAQKVADENRVQGQKEADAVAELYQEDARKAEEAHRV